MKILGFSFGVGNFLGFPNLSPLRWPWDGILWILFNPKASSEYMSKSLKYLINALDSAFHVLGFKSGGLFIKFENLSDLGGGVFFQLLVINDVERDGELRASTNVVRVDPFPPNSHLRNRIEPNCRIERWKFNEFKINIKLIKNSVI